MSGLRTERVTLEVTQRAESYAPCRDLDWQRMLRQTPGGLFPGESVRVVEDGSIPSPGALASPAIVEAHQQITALTAELEALRRERDQAKEECKKLREQLAIRCTTAANLRGVIRERDKNIGTLEARVASLESQLESVACRAATAETALREIFAQDYARSSVNGACWKMHDIAEKALKSAPAASVQTDEEDADIGYALRLFVDGRRVLSHELDRQQAGAFLIAADHLAKYLRTEYQAQFDESAPAASGNSSGILTSSPAASGVAGSYWMVRWPEGSDHDIDEEIFPDEQTARDMAELEDGAVVVELVERQAASVAAGTGVVSAEQPPSGYAYEYPHYPPPVATVIWFTGGETINGSKPLRAIPYWFAPQAAPGWLTAEERKAVAFAADQAPESDFVTSGEGEWVKETLTALLGRSSPPEVVLPDFTPDAVRNLDTKYLAGWDQCMALAKRAISDAGVKVKEVGCE